MTDPGGTLNHRARGAIAEYHATIAIFPDRTVLEPEPAFEGWTTFVSHRAVRAIAVAPASGIVWIATWGGVLAWNRTDTYVYRRYSSEHGLAGTPSCIAVADDDHPWVGQVEGGLSWFDGNRWQPHDHLRDTPILAVAAARGGRVWVATPESIALVERGQSAVEIVRGDADLVGATALLGDGDGVLVGSPAGLHRVAERAPITRLHQDVVTECTALARAADGGLVIGTPSGVVVDNTLVAPDGSDGFVVSVAPSRTGIWVLTRTELARIERGQWRALGETPEGMATPRVVAVARPNDDYVWIGTDDLVSGARPGGDAPWDIAVLPNHAEDALSNLGRCAVGHASGRVWIGTAGGLFTGEANGTWSFDAEAGDVRSLMLAARTYGDESLWVLTWPTGASRVATAGRISDPLVLPPGMPRALVRSQDARPHAWIGDALWRLDRDPPEVEAHGVPQHARILVSAPRESWYAATDRGLFLYGIVDNRWTLVRDFGITPITALIQYGPWWVAGTAGAFWMLEANGWRKVPLGNNGRMWTEPVTAFASSRSSRYEKVWVACGGRVARCNTEDGTVHEVYDRFDSGVCGNAITALVEADGVLWVVSRTGIARHVLQR